MMSASQTVETMPCKQAEYQHPLLLQLQSYLAVSLTLHRSVSGFVNTDLANGWLTGTDVIPAAVQQVVRPLVRALCPWILVAPSKAVQTVLYAATAPSAEVRSTLLNE